MPSAAARARRDEPQPDLGRLALARRVAAGYAPAEAARAVGAPAAEVETLLADPGFAELVDAYRELEARPEDEQVARLVRVAKCVLEDALNRGDVRASLFVVTEGQDRGRDPARVLAERAVRALRRRAPAATAAPVPVTSDQRLPPAGRYEPPSYKACLIRLASARLGAALRAEHAALAPEAVAEPPSPQPSPITRATGEGAREGPRAAGSAPSPVRRMGEGRGEGVRAVETAPAAPPPLNRRQRRRLAALERRGRPPPRSRSP